MRLCHLVRTRPAGNSFVKNDASSKLPSVLRRPTRISSQQQVEAHSGRQHEALLEVRRIPCILRIYVDYLIFYSIQALGYVPLRPDTMTE